MILFKKQLFDLEVRDTPPYGHATTYQNIIDLSRKTKMLWPGQENTI
jgi:hypothetical protein